MATFEYTFAATAVVTVVLEAQDADAGADEARAVAEAELRRADDELGGYASAVALMDLEGPIQVEAYAQAG